MDVEQKIAEIVRLERIHNPAKTLRRILWLMACLTIPPLLSGQDTSHLQNVHPVETTPELVPQIGHVDQPLSIDLGGRGDLLVTASPDKIILWDRASGQQLRSFAPTQNGLQYVGAALASDEKAVIGLDRYHLDFWNASTGGLIRQVDLPDVGPLGTSSMRVSPDGTRAALSGRGEMGPTSAPFVVSLESGKRLVELEGKYRFASYALAFSPDGQLLADGNYDQFARVHDVGTGKLLAEFTPKTGPIESVAFSPDGKRIAATTNDECHSLDKPGTSSVGSANRAHDCNGHIRRRSR
jgi:WD40 repeat protein